MQEITDKNFESEVIKAELPALVDFWAPWCGPCRALAPVLEAVSDKYTGKVKFGKVNTDENPAVAGRFGIMSIPTLIIFRQGKEIDRSVGYQSPEELSRKIDKLLAKK